MERASGARVNATRAFHVLAFRMPGRVGVPQRIVQHISIAVQTARIAGVGDDGIGLHEAADVLIIPTGIVVMQADIALLSVSPLVGAYVGQEG